MDRIVALVACAGITGCSFLTVDELPDHPRPGQPVECTTSRVAPAIDLVPAIALDLLALAALGFAAFAHGDGELGHDADLVLEVGLAEGVVGGGYTASAIYGWRAVNRCRAAR
jgi:hypothetical protein